MSDGGGESGRKEKEQSSQANRKCSSDEFAHGLSKIAVAQICDSVGFQSFQQSTLEKLADIATRYIYDIGKTAHSHTNLGGRVEGNFFDIVRGLEDLGLAQGFAGASDVHHSLGSSGIVTNLMRYISESESPPFAYSVPRFPHVKDREPTPSFLQTAEEPPGEHIPAWLPAFPDPQTYLPLSAENETESHAEKTEQGWEQIKSKRPLLNLQQRFSSNESEGPSINSGDNNKGKQVAEANPFLAAPLHFADKNVSHVALPTKFSSEAADRHHVLENCTVVKYVSVMDTFTPGIEAMKSRLSDNDGGQKTRILDDQRPAVQFKFKTGKKSLGTSLDLSPQNKGVEKITPLFGNDKDKNDRQRRAEKILKDSMDNTQELAQL